MKIAKVIASVGLAAALGFGMTSCAALNYNGEGVVVSKDIEKDKKSSSGTGKKKKTKTVTEYMVVVDVPDTDMNRSIEVDKSRYDRIKVGDKVVIDNNKLK